MFPLVLFFLMFASPCLAKGSCRGSPDLDTKITLEPDASGSIIIEGIVFTNGSWYLSEENTTRLCFCDVFPCFRKCCSHPRESIDLVSTSCTNITDPSLPPFVPEVYNRSNWNQRVSIKTFQTFRTTFNNLDMYMYPSGDFEFSLLNDGTLLLRERCGETTLRPETFCIDRVENTEETVVLAMKEYMPEACFVSLNIPIKRMIFPLAMLGILPFLAVTFLTYALVPKLRNLHGRCLMCHVSSLFVGYLSFGAQRLCRSPVCDAVCVPSALVAYMGFLSAFFWLNIMCYDIWSIFRVIKPRKLTPKEECRKFYTFAAYSWGCPLLIVVLTSLLQFYAKELPRSIIKPDIGVRRCWFSGKRQKALYLLLPSYIILISNIYFIGYVMNKIRKLRKDSEILRNSEDENCRETDRFRFMQYLKLFFTMGLTRIMEGLDIFSNIPTFFGDIGILLNWLQGLMILIIFVSDRRTRGIIKDFINLKKTKSKTYSTKL